eukprot:gene15779-biopygen23225
MPVLHQHPAAPSAPRAAAARPPPSAAAQADAPAPRFRGRAACQGNVLPPGDKLGAYGSLAPRAVPQTRRAVPTLGPGRARGGAPGPRPNLGNVPLSRSPLAPQYI